MLYNFCTLFDKNYAFRGLALHDSIVRYCPDFQLYILCLDAETYDLLKKLALKNTILIKLSDIEDTQLLAAKANRSRGEYCWTLGSVFTNYLLKNQPELTDLAYLDSDIYFYSSPQPIYDELGSDSVLIIRHNYEERLKYLEKSGIYNVALIIFKNNEIGQAVLAQWSQACLKWCYNRHEEGKFGDQMYLDTWPQDFAGIHVLKHPGANVAPWNANRYHIRENNGQILIDNQPLIFYHTHTLRIIAPQKYELHSSFYRLNPIIEKIIYRPYTTKLDQVIAQVKIVDAKFNYGYRSPEGLLDKFKQILKRLAVALYFSHKKYE
ncbi:MAG: glycosyl transferase [Patescibacteria group bacterium]